MDSFKLPKGWTRETIPEGTLFSYGSGDTSRTCLIRDDMTVEVRAMGLVTKLLANNKISNPKDVKQIVRGVHEARLCRGIQDGYGCKNILFLPPPKTNALCIRCPDCRKRFTYEKNNIKRRKKRIEMREDISNLNENETVCIVKDCPGRNTGSIRLFPVPKLDIEAWCENLQLQVSDVDDNMRVCSRHFDEASLNPRSLRFGARPTLNLGHKGFIRQSALHRTMIRVCCIVGCHVTSPPNRLFGFPEDKQLLKQWLLICVIKEELMGNKHKYICSKHFEPSMFRKNKYFLQPNALPKMDVESWLNNNANKDCASKYLNKVQSEKKFSQKTPKIQAFNAVKEALSDKLSQDDCMEGTNSDSDSNCLECLQCKNVCFTCAKAFKECEAYREGCYELEKQLQEEQEKIAELKIENEQLFALLEANNFSE